MRLTELNPAWTVDGIASTHGAFIEIDCPCGSGKCPRLPIPFKVRLDGSPGHDHGWERTGDTFETLTLRPSILRPPRHYCGWHGFITNGEVTSC